MLQRKVHIKTLLRTKKSAQKLLPNNKWSSHLMGNLILEKGNISKEDIFKIECEGNTYSIIKILDVQTESVSENIYLEIKECETEFDVLKLIGSNDI